MTTAAFVNHLWQCTIFAGAAWLVTLALHRNRAGVRHAVWLLASLKFLVPFAVLVSAGSRFGWRASQIAAQASITQIVETVSLPLSVPPIAMENVVSAAGVPAGGSAILLLLLMLWLGGAAAMIVVWIVRWRRVAAIVRAGDRAEHGPVLDSLRRIEARIPRTRPLPLVVSNSPFEPGVFGMLRPVLLWPRDLEAHLTLEQIDTIVAHEVAHVRRRDNLGAALHMVVQAVFWIHPLVWWIGARLVDERERACDEDVVRMGGDPRAYAESILKTCQWCVEAPLACVAGVTGSNLKRRVEQIMSADARAALSAWTRSVLAVAAMGSVAVPIAVGALGAPPLRADERVVRESQASPAAQTAAPAAKPITFEVASVKPNTSGDGRVLITPQPGGRLNLVNVPLRFMIRYAYRVQDFQVVGGPDWLGTARFDVVAKAEAGNPSQEELQLMLRSLLADRFKLVVRPDRSEMPTYSLVQARADGKTGAQLRKSDANCGPASAPPAPGQFPPCGSMVGFGSLKARGSTMPALATGLSTFAGRIVVDRTGLAGGYDVDLNWTPDQIPRPAGGGDQPVQVNGVTVDPNGPSLFTALQEQLGLKLESARGPVDVLVVERAEKPAED